MTAVERYLEHLNKIFQVEPEFFREDSLIPSVHNVSSIVYRNIPEHGMITGLTYGLSLIDHPDWKASRPELCISVESEDTSWARVAAFLANQARGKFSFCYGQTINFRERISDESEMDAFLLFAPAILEQEDYSSIDLGQGYKVNITGLYPIYSSELDVYHEIGLKQFWHHPNFDMYNVKRPKIAL